MKRERRRLQARFDALYPLPDPYDTWEQWQQREHRDLAAMTPSQLRAEQEKLKLLLLYDPAPHGWFVERALALDAILRHAA